MKLGDFIQSGKWQRTILFQTFFGGLAVLILFSASHWKNKSMIGAFLFLTGTILTGIAVVGRSWASLYIAGYKVNTLVTSGPYSISRNPLYLFNLIGAEGVGLTTETLVIPIILLICFILYYPSVIRKEEKRLSAIHKEDFDNYCKRIPRFLPSFSTWHEPEEYTVKPKIFRKALRDVVWFVWVVGIVEFLEACHEHRLVPVLFSLY
jgi:protein-S-isoprenylcysteine O-methyltransferase Ste14